MAASNPYPASTQVGGTYPPSQYPPQPQYAQPASQYPQPQQYPPSTQGYPPPQQYPPPAQGYPQPQQYPPAPQYAQPQSQYPPSGQYPPQQYPPPPQYAQSQYPAGKAPQGQQVQVVVVDQSQVFWGPVPVTTVCGHCKKAITTIMMREVGTGTWVACILICFFVGIPWNYIPFCCDGCKDIKHICPECNTVVGRKDMC